MAEAQDYQGGCHCGAVRFSVTTGLEPVIECNCSHCSKKGFLLTFVPAEQFALQAGEDALTDYRFNTHKIRHRFCKVCGVQAFGEGVSKEGRATRAINVRCLDGIDLGSVKRTPWDGASQ
jgi:hypothetical protein